MSWELRDVVPGLWLWRVEYPDWRLLELPFEHVVVSHGEPVHDRTAYERALELPPWPD